LHKLKVPFGVVINRSDLGDENTRNFCKKEKISMLMEIPFKKEIAACYSKGVPVIDEFPEYKAEYRNLFQEIEHRGAS